MSRVDDDVRRSADGGSVGTALLTEVVAVADAAPRRASLAGPATR